MTLLEYNELKQQVVYNVSVNDHNDHLLNQLKEFYKDDIDSNRRYEQINTIGQLIKILEIRNILSEDDVSPFKEIARRLNNTDLLRSIVDYESTHVAREYVNHYAYEGNHVTISPSNDALPLGHPYGNISPRKKSRINEAIVEEIGTFWRDLARNLRIQEHKIDEIDKNKATLAEKAVEVLKLYENKADPQRGFYALCHALEKARRKDLSRHIQEIMVMNI